MAIAATIMAAAVVAVAAQSLAFAALPDQGPLEYADFAFNAMMALTLSVITVMAARRDGKASLLWTALSIAGWMWFAADVVDLDEWRPGFIVPDDAWALIVWALTAIAIIPALGAGKLSAGSRMMLGVGLVLQSLAFTADLGDGTIFHLPDNMLEGLDTLGLAAYVAGILLVAIPLFSATPRKATPLRWAFLVSEPGRLMSIAVEDLSWRMWRLRHPGAAFSGYYAGNISRKLDKGKAHRTLGQQQWSKERPLGGNGVRAAKFASEGLTHFQSIMALGVTADSTIVDYGCGSLRIGQHFIRFLDPGRYWGLDVTDRFYSDGLALIGPETVAAKAPHLHVIGGGSLALTKAANPDIIFSIAVLKHVPESELETYWKNVLGLMGGGSIAFVRCDVADDYTRTAAKNWAHTEASVREIIAYLAPDLPVVFDYTMERDGIGGRRVRSANVIVGFGNI